MQLKCQFPATVFCPFDYLLPPQNSGIPMQLFKRVQDLRDWLAAMKNIQKIIGFVPTMGALHEGHLSLAVRCTAECDITVVSIFVNPKQFNDPSDLAKYPRF